MRNKPNIKDFKNFLRHLLSGLLLILGGLFVYLAAVIAVGYLPYSDRPSPGWYKSSVHLNGAALSYILGFLLFLGIYVLAVLIIVYVIFLIFRLIGYDRLVFAVLGSLTIGFLSFYVTLGIGWYIAIDTSTVFVGGLLGLIYGATLFPKYLKPVK